MRKIKIIQGDKGSIDLESEIELTPLQKERFLNFFKANYKAVKIVENKPFREERLNPNRMFRRLFIDEETPHLLNLVLSIDKVAESLGRPTMTVAKKRGELLPAFMRWAKEMNRDMVKEDMTMLIKDFIEYQKKLRKAKRRQKEENKKRKRSIQDLKNELKSWKSPEKRKEIDFLIRIGKLNGDSEGIIDKKINKIMKELANINSKPK